MANEILFAEIKAFIANSQNGDEIKICLPSGKEVIMDMSIGMSHYVSIKGYGYVDLPESDRFWEGIKKLLKRANMPDLGITYDLEYSRSLPVMGWGVENFHVPNVIPCWLTNKEMKLYKQLIKYSDTGRFSTGSVLWGMYNELRNAVAERYW